MIGLLQEVCLNRSKWRWPGFARLKSIKPITSCDNYPDTGDRIGRDHLDMLLSCIENRSYHLG
jgi:hypothetical protein